MMPKKKIKEAIKNAIYGTSIVAGFIMIMCCDTETPGQLLIICLAGFGLLCFGGRALVKGQQ